MKLTQKLTQQNVFKRIVWAYTILYLVPTLTAFAVGYFLLPEGFLRDGSSTTPAEIVAQQIGFWPQFLSTIGFNLGLISVFGIGLNTLRLKGFSTGYLYIFVQAVMCGIVAGTNSFVVQVISPYTLEGWLVALRIGHLEFLGYTCIVGSTIGVVLLEDNSPLRLSWKLDKSDRVRSWRDIRFSRQEIIGLIIGIILVIAASYNETVLVF